MCQYLLHHEEGSPLCEVLVGAPQRLVNMLGGQLTPTPPMASPAPVRTELQYRAVRLIALLVRFDDKWMQHHPQIVSIRNFFIW